MTESAGVLTATAILDATAQSVRSDTPRGPVDAKLSVLCARLLMLTGQWDPALSQLDGAVSLDARSMLIAHTYRGLIQAEQARAAVFAGKSSPGVIGGSKSWIAQLLTCLSLDRQGNPAWAAELRRDALEAAPEVVGFLNGAAIASIEDVDSRLGPVLEVIVGGSYYWAPFACIRHFRIERLGEAHDFPWLPTQLTWSSGERSTGFIPMRYPGSEHSEDEAVRMGGKTHWEPAGEHCQAGLGLRRLRTDTGEVSILEVTDLSLTPCVSATRELFLAEQ